MSIQVACTCGQQFAAQPHLAGKRVKCPTCGQPLNIPHPNSPTSPNPAMSQPNIGQLPGPGFPQQQMPAATPLGQPLWQSQMKPAKRRFHWKLPIIIAGSVGGVALVTTIIIVLVMNVVGSLALDEGGEGASDAESDPELAMIESWFERPPRFDFIVATNENWAPDESLLDELGPEISVDGYTMRLPRGFNASSNPSLPKNSWTRTQQNGLLEERVFLRVSSKELNEDVVRGIENRFLVYHEMNSQFKGYSLKRGKLNGLPCWQETRAGRLQPKSQSYWIEYYMLDGTNEVHLRGFCFAEPGSRQYRIFETALRTLKPE